MRLALPASLLALLLASCEKCDSCKDGTCAQGPKTPAAASAPAAPAEAAEAEPTPPVVKVAWRGTGTTLELSVWQMHCAGCEMDVEEALKGLAGVRQVKADHATSTVTVEMTDAARRDALIASVRTALQATRFRILGE